MSIIETINYDHIILQLFQIFVFEKYKFQITVFNKKISK